MFRELAKLWVPGRRLLLLPLLLVLVLAAACSQTTADEPAVPTVAATEQPAEIAAVVEQEIATLPPPLIVEATFTPIPATETPLPTETPAVTATPTETPVPPTNTPAPIPPTNVPPPAQPTAVPPTDTPAPPPPPQIGANGLVADLFALQDRSVMVAGEPVWFEFNVANSTGGEVPYNAIGVMPKKDGVDRFEWYQQTYGGPNSTVKPGGLAWEDRIKLPEPGNYTLRLVVCFDGFDNCLQGGGAWQSLSNEIPVTIN